jgi:hypothetical protein
MDAQPTQPQAAWLERWTLDANLSPTIERLNGDVTTGYKGDRFGFHVHGETTYFSIDEGRSFSLTERYAGSVDLWGLVDVHPIVRLEPRLSGGASYYGTMADEVTTTSNRQSNHDSIFGRGIGSLGVRVQPSTRVSIAASFGAGYQYEDYFRVAQSSAGEQATSFDAASTLRYEARLRARVVIVPDVVSFRALGDFDSFVTHRSDLAVTYSPGRASASEGATEIAQTELFARGYLDADIARFFGFVPAVHGGANMFFLSSPSTSTAAVTPVFGIGVRREAL